MARIELDGVTKQFHRVVAVRDLGLEMPDGSFTALLGPSGCGKTTTLNMIAGLESPTEGEIRFDGERVNAVPARRRKIGFVFQNYAIFDRMTVYDNLAFGLKVRRLPSARIDEEVLRAASLLDIEPLLTRRATELSVNDLQKVAIGRSMVVNPSIFLLDEPLSNLDAGFRAYMRVELKRLQRELAQTMVYVTHDQVEAMAMADQIAVMDRGGLQQLGTPGEIYGRPANRFVAGFVGTAAMNFLSVMLRDGADVLDLQPAGCRPIGLCKELVRAVTGVAGPLTMGVRPEHVRVTEPAGPFDIRGTVALVEPLGSKKVVHVQCSGHELRAVVPPRVRIARGEAVGLELDHNHIHLFDDESGKALR